MTIELDRRNFLIGLFGSAAVAAAGKLPTIPTMFDSNAWVQAIVKVYGEHINNVLIYGTSAIRYVDEFPYVKVIHPSEMNLDELARATTKEGLLPVTDILSDESRELSDAIGNRAIERMIVEEKARRHSSGES